MQPLRSLAFCAIALACHGAPGAITVDYPQPGTIFPPDIAAPRFEWRDPSPATWWRIDVSFGGRFAALRAFSRGPRIQLGPLDPDCAADSNQPPQLTPEQAAARSWRPGAAMWALIKKRSADGPARIVIRGFASGRVVSRGEVSITASKDPVGAPIFYRDVPLMPAMTEKGVIQPLAPMALRLVKWRLKDISKTGSRIVMERLPVCANCHSFSDDGKTLGMDLDGLQGNKGQYFRVPVQAATTVRHEDLIQWSGEQGRLRGRIRVGFMSRLSPDGKYVATTVNPVEAGPRDPDPPSNYYVMNFADYRFLQVFFPTRGIIEWYSRESGVLQPLPGADDPRYVQFGAVWSPDGQFLVFARAGAMEPNPEGAPAAQYANDPNERQIQYGLYRIPFNGGRGGVAEPLRGASANGMSNTFPKVSPDGKWIVFVKARNGQLMRPDSELWIVPSSGGEARKMRCNTPLMNSWHSFSPNGRWMVFSSKARSPYTQMYLTHIDGEGNDSPPVLIEGTTAANRAVNLPEFVNVRPDGFQSLGGPALEFYRLYDRAMYYQKQSRFSEAVEAWRRVLAVKPGDEMSLNQLGLALLRTGRAAEARQALAEAAKARGRQRVGY
jgi:hypothetical protein